MKWYLKVLTESYANFQGRARRQEYWMFVLFQILIVIGLSFLSSLIEEFIEINVLGIVFLIYFGGTLIPWLALNVRRLHDLGKSGTYFFINFIPIIGRIWYIILVASNGDYGPNRYGLDPKIEYLEDEINQIGEQQDY
jgi:uncharacterized membrane protein YhaH (DUF805 family)